MSPDRFLIWEGCFNARDLGGLKARRGMTRRGAVVRADSLDGLSARGWEAVVEHGVRTVIDLRNDDEVGESAARPSSVKTIRLPLDGCEDESFWKVWSSSWEFGTPLYYRPHLDRFPERHAAVISAIASAEPGGVVVHCSVGRDRTGLISMLLLAIAGVSHEAIAADYELSAGRLAPLFARRGLEDQGPLIESFLRARELTLRDTVLSVLAELDVEAVLVRGGLSAAELSAVRTRLVAPE